MLGLPVRVPSLSGPPTQGERYINRPSCCLDGCLIFEALVKLSVKSVHTSTHIEIFLAPDLVWHLIFIAFHSLGQLDKRAIRPQHIMAQAYAYTVYRGTFIQTPRLPESTRRPKAELVRNRGALWVSSADGRIKGFDWQARDDASFKALMSRNGWVDVDAAETNGYDGNEVKVKIVLASEERNEFFFPGFIGMFPSEPRSIIDKFIPDLTTRHTYPCTTIPECWPVRLFDFARLAGNVYVSC